MKKITQFPTLLVLFLIVTFFTNSSIAENEIGFIKNLGQIQDQNLRPNSSVLYLIQTGNFKIQLRNDGFSYEVLSKDALTASLNAIKQKHQHNRIAINYESHRIDFNFLGGNPSSIEESEKLNFFLNYFIDNKQVTEIPIFKKIVYKNIWENIDIEFIINEKDSKNPFKYNFIIHEKGNIESIQLQVKGTDIQQNKDGSILLPNKYGDINEIIPNSYIKDANRAIEETKVTFKSEQNIIRFQHENSSLRSGTLIIDPSPIRLWSSYAGGFDIDLIQGMSVDSIGNIAYGGLTISTNNIATIGAFQVSMPNVGVPSGFVIKTNPNGMRTWGTYINGNDFTLVNKVEIDKAGAVVAFGETSSTINISSIGAFQANNNSPDSYDAFVMKFNANNGLKLWGTYLGGLGEESAYDLAIDGANNIYVGGQTTSGDAFIQTSASFNSVFNGASDGFLTKISAGGNKIWSTFIGGNNSDAIVGVKVDRKGNLYVGGNTTSSDSIATAGTHKPTLSTNFDCFLMKINPADGFRQWGTYYGGNGDDEMESMAVDTSGNIAICGQTYSKSGIATFCTEQGRAPSYTEESSASYVAKFFGTTGLIDFGTYFGKQISTIRAVAVDVNKNVYVGGETSESSMSTTGAFQTSLNNGQDAYIAKINTQGLQEWCSFFGGDGDGDFLTALKTNSNNLLVAAGYTNSTSGLANGGPQASFSGIIDGWFAKFQDTTKNVRVKYSITATSSVILGSCINGSNGIAKASGTGGFSPYSFEWNNGITLDTNRTLAPGAYSVTIYDSKGCGAESKGNVPSIALPSPNLGPDRTVCIGSSTTIKAQGGGTYIWSTGATTDSIVVSPTIVTNYLVTVTSPFGCVNRDTIRINIAALPIANAGVDKTTCAGKPTSLTATGGGTYRWSSGQTTATINVTPTTTTSYIVTVTNNSGCTARDTATVFVDTIPTPGTPPSLGYCAGSLATITAMGGGTYLWSNGSNQASITVEPKIATTYTVTVTNSKGCTQVASTIVTPIALPNANAGQNQSLCEGQEATLNGSGGLTYQWSTGENTQSIKVKPLVTTDYYLTVTNQAGCSNKDTVRVTIKSLPNLTLSDDVTICEGVSVKLDAMTGANNVVSWSTGQNGNSITVVPKTTTSYWVNVLNSNTSCSISDTIKVTVNPKPAVKASPDISICLGKSTLLQAGNGVKYEWSDGQKGTSITVTPTFTTLYTVTVTDANGCSNTTQTLVTIIQPPSISISPNITICPGGNAIIQAEGGSNYTWSNGSTQNSINVKPSQTTTYTVTVTNQNGCSATASTTVTIGSTINASAGSDRSICKGQITTLTATGGSEYLWSTGEKTDKIFVSPSNTTTYTVTVTSGGCSATAVVTIRVNSNPTISLGKDTTICLGSSVVLKSNTTDKVLWSTGETKSEITITPSKSDFYVITVTNSNNCSALDSILVQVLSLPNADAGVDKKLCLGKSVTLIASGGSNYLWSTGENLSTISVNTPVTKTYFVTVTDINGCSAKDSVKVTVVALPTVNLGNDTLKALIGQTVKLDAGAGLTYKWSTGQTTQTISVISPSAQYCVTVTNSDGCKATDCIYVKFDPNATIELEDENIKVYPNPTQSDLFIEAVQGILPKEITVEAIDGKVLGKQTLENQSKAIIKVEHLPTGMYILKMKKEDKILIYRIIKE